MDETNPTSSTPTLLVALAWIVVAAPLLWGLAQTIMKAAPLFRG
jgi:hypothetical protein